MSSSSRQEKIGGGMGTGRKEGTKILGVVSETVAKDFLVRFANLRDDSAGWLRSKFPEMFHASTSDALLFRYRRELRKAWDARDQRHRDWYTFSLRLSHAVSERSFASRENRFFAMEETLIKGPAAKTSENFLEWLSEPPAMVTPLEATLLYFQTRIGDLAKHCGHADCPTPYFIADKRWQKFCSEKCAGPANREAKRKWWHDNMGKGANQ